MRCVEIAATDGAILAAVLPTAAGFDPLQTVAWCGALLLCATFDAQAPLTWTSFGWLAAAIAPGVAPAALGASGGLGAGRHPWRIASCAAIGAVTLPPVAAQSGPLLLLCGLLAAARQGARARRGS